MSLRPIALAACLAAVAFAAPGNAAPAPQIVDPKGDAIGVDPGLDIVSGTFSTKGTTTTTKVRGKKVTKYTPTDLVITIEMAGPVSKQRGTTLHVDTVLEGCGQFYIIHSPDTALGEYNTAYLECAGSDDPTDTSSILPMSPKISGNTITWSIKLRTFGKNAGPGMVFNELSAYTAPAEPVTGIIDTASVAPPLVFDRATGTSYVVK